MKQYVKPVGEPTPISNDAEVEVDGDGDRPQKRTDARKDGQRRVKVAEVIASEKRCGGGDGGGVWPDVPDVPDDSQHVADGRQQVGDAETDEQPSTARPQVDEDDVRDNDRQRADDGQDRRE